MKTFKQFFNRKNHYPKYIVTDDLVMNYQYVYKNIFDDKYLQIYGKDMDKPWSNWEKIPEGFGHGTPRDMIKQQYDFTWKYLMTNKTQRKIEEFDSDDEFERWFTLEKL